MTISHGTGKTKICDNPVRFINVVGKCIYFQNIGKNPALYKMNTDGKGFIQLGGYNAPLMYVNVVGDYVYFISDSPNIGLYRVKTDGTSRMLLEKNIVSNINVDNEYIYYNMPGKGIYKMKLNGTKKMKLVGFISKEQTKIEIADGWIYYNINNTFKRVKLDGSLSQEVLSAQLSPPGSIAPLIAIKRESKELLPIADQKASTTSNAAIETITEDTSYWMTLKNRPSGNDALNIKMASTMQGLGSIGFTSDDSNKAVAISGKLYMIDNDGTVREYDPIADTWRSLSVISELKDSKGIFKLITINNKLVIAGANYTDVLEYDIATNKCSLMTHLPTPSVIGAAVELDGKLYVLSGFATGSPNTMETMYEYDPKISQWTRKADMFEGANGLAAVAYNNRIYIMGARSRNSKGQNIEVYDVIKNEWSYIEADDNSWYGEVMVVFNNKIYVFPDGITDLGVKTYNPINNVWEKAGKSSKTGYGFAATAVNGSIYVISGANVQKYVPPSE